MVRVGIKPLSVNQVWQGRRFKTRAYKDYEEELLWKLPDLRIPDGDLSLAFVFGLSNKASDIDNPLKPVLDVLQKRYGFDDKRIYHLEIEKVIVKKGEEFIEFAFAPRM